MLSLSFLWIKLTGPKGLYLPYAMVTKVNVVFKTMSLWNEVFFVFFSHKNIWCPSLAFKSLYLPRRGLLLLICLQVTSRLMVSIIISLKVNLPPSCKSSLTGIFSFFLQHWKWHDCFLSLRKAWKPERRQDSKYCGLLWQLKQSAVDWSSIGLVRDVRTWFCHLCYDWHLEIKSSL